MAEGSAKQQSELRARRESWDDVATGTEAAGYQVDHSARERSDAEARGRSDVEARGPARERPDLDMAGVADGPRPRRGLPEQTRARLTRTAQQVFNRVTYWEADTNAIAKEAGYSTGTFYRHFKDKREIFVAAYRAWMAEEWANVEATVLPGQSPEESIDRAADALIEHHRRWRVFRGNMRALITYDEELRELTHALRREQLEKMNLLRMRQGEEGTRTLESDAVYAMMFERVCDAIADDEFQSLGCSLELAQAEFRRLMRQYLHDPSRCEDS